jgi:hypothetical protein
MLGKYANSLHNIKKSKYFFNLAAFQDTMMAEQPSSEEWYIAIQYGSCPNLKGEVYEHGILCTIG